MCSCRYYLEHPKIPLLQLLEHNILHQQQQEYAPGSIYRSILSSYSYCWQIFTTQSILLDNGNIVQWKQNLIFFLPRIGILRFFLPFFGILKFLSSQLWYFGIFLCLLWYFGGKCRCKCPRWLSPRLALHLHRATVSRKQKTRKEKKATV